MRNFAGNSYRKGITNTLTPCKIDWDYKIDNGESLLTQDVNMKVTLQTLTGTKYFLEVEPWEKATELKVKIFRELDVKSKVRLLWQNKPLEDAVTLRAQGITEDAIIQMLIEPGTKIKLRIKTVKKGTFSVELNDSSTIQDLMKKVQMSTLRFTADISDFYFGKVNLSDENLPFHLYGISEGSVITQIYQGSFELKVIDARSCTFVRCITVRSTDSIKELRDNVLHSINSVRKEDSCQITEGQIVSFHQEIKPNIRSGVIKNIYYHELDRETKTISQCGIKPLDVIVFIHYHGDLSLCPDIMIDEYPSHISTKKVPKSKKMFEVYPLESVLSLRLKIQHQFHVPYEKQGIVITGMDHPLADAQKVGSDELNKVFVTTID